MYSLANQPQKNLGLWVLVDDVGEVFFGPQTIFNETSSIVHDTSLKPIAWMEERL